MEVGTVVKAVFPQADRQIKVRPAVIIKFVPPYNDCMICAVSTQTGLLIPELNIMLDKNSYEFTTSGLLRESIIRVGMVATVPDTLLLGAIGKISQATCEKIIFQLKKFL